MVSARMCSCSVRWQAVGINSQLLGYIRYGSRRGLREIVRAKPQIAQGAELESKAQSIVISAGSLTPELLLICGGEGKVRAQIFSRNIAWEALPALALGRDQKQAGVLCRLGHQMQGFLPSLVQVDNSLYVGFE